MKFIEMLKKQTGVQTVTSLFKIPNCWIFYNLWTEQMPLDAVISEKIVSLVCILIPDKRTNAMLVRLSMKKVLLPHSLG